MNYIVIFFAIWVIVCWQLIGHTIRENHELHLVYKRPKWMRRQIDKGSYYDKTGRYFYLKKRIEGKQYNPNDRQMQKDIRDIVRLGRELNASDSQMAVYNKNSQRGDYMQ